MKLSPIFIVTTFCAFGLVTAAPVLTQSPPVNVPQHSASNPPQHHWGNSAWHNVVNPSRLYVPNPPQHKHPSPLGIEHGPDPSRLGPSGLKRKQVDNSWSNRSPKYPKIEA